MTHAIKRLELTNFQAHEHTEINPAPPGGLTVIVGPSGHGKTAILRALRWLLYNQPQSMGFMRKGAQVVQVTAELTGGTVTRRRTASTNQYIAVTESGRQVFEGFGADVPLEIQQLTGVREMQVADLAIAPNFAEQLDGPFLGERVTSAGTRAKVLGRIAGIDEVDLAAKSLATDQFRRGQEERRLDREAADLAAQEARYAHLPELHRRIEALDALLARLAQVEERRTAVTRAAERLRQIRAARQQAQVAFHRWVSILPVVEVHVAEVEAAIARLSSVDTLAARFRAVQVDRQAAQAIVTRWQGAGAVLDILLATSQTAAQRDRVATALGRLRQTGNSITTVQAAMRRLEGAAQATDILAQAVTATGHWGTLVRLQASLAPIAPAKQAAASVLARAGKAQAVLASVTALQDTLAHRDRAASLGMGLMMCRMSIEQTEGRVATAQRQAKEAEQAYIDTLTAAGRCPVCGGEIHPEHLKEAV